MTRQNAGIPLQHGDKKTVNTVSWQMLKYENRCDSNKSRDFWDTQDMIMIDYFEEGKTDCLLLCSIIRQIIQRVKEGP